MLPTPPSASQNLADGFGKALKAHGFHDERGNALLPCSFLVDPFAETSTEYKIGISRRICTSAWASSAPVISGMV